MILPDLRSQGWTTTECMVYRGVLALQTIAGLQQQQATVLLEEGCQTTASRLALVLHINVVVARHNTNLSPSDARLTHCCAKQK